MDVNTQQAEMLLMYCVLVLLGSLLAYCKLCPSHASKMKKTFAAWLCSKIMWRVHAKCIDQKKTLFSYFELLQSKRPHILEVGVGTGNNLAFLPAECELYCLDPNQEHQKYVLQALVGCPGIRLKKFMRGFAENMSEFGDNTFDAIVCTFTLCSVRHPDKAVSEIKRVLKPGGLFLFMEHVAAPQSSFHRTVQKYLQWVWPTLSDGCHLTRETWTLIENGHFAKINQEHFQIDTRLFAFMKYGLYGYAIK